MACPYPVIFASGDWYTLSYIAKRIGKPQRTIQHWMASGLFTRMGLKVVRLPARRGREARTWVQVPRSSIYARFRNLPLDIPLPPSIPSNL